MRVGSQGKGDTARGLLVCSLRRAKQSTSARHTHDDGSEPTHAHVSCVAKVIEAIDTDNYPHLINIP